MRAPQGRIKEDEIDLANNGDKVYYKKAGEDKWRGPGVVIRRDGLLRNVTKIHITRIQKLQGEVMQK